MKVITMKLSELVKPEKNVRIHTEQQLKEFERCSDRLDLLLWMKTMSF